MSKMEVRFRLRSFQARSSLKNAQWAPSGHEGWGAVLGWGHHPEHFRLLSQSWLNHKTTKGIHTFPKAPFQEVLPQQELLPQTKKSHGDLNVALNVFFIAC